MNYYTIKKYESKFHSDVVDLYRALKSKYQDAVYWWPGKESFTWSFCDCAFQREQLVGKGQVKPIVVIEEGSQSKFKHKIFINIKIHPDYEKDIELYQALYESLYQKALQIKEKLPAGFDSLLCVGNFRDEEANNTFYESIEFKPLNSLFGMISELSEEVSVMKRPEGIDIRHWKIDLAEEQTQYLQAEKEIWPENPLGLERLLEFKSYPNWTAITAFDNGGIVGSVMAWEDPEERAGLIEDLFVKETHRKIGLGRYLLSEGLSYLNKVGLKQAQLEVVTDNNTALNLYRSAGFKEISEEKRYYIELE